MWGTKADTRSAESEIEGRCATCPLAVEPHERVLPEVEATREAWSDPRRTAPGESPDLDNSG